MPITSITISQNNIVNGSNLLPVHSPLAFIVDVEYTSLPPTDVRVQIYKSGDLLTEYKLVPINDLLANLKQFAFMADEVIRGLMSDFEDEAQLNNTLSYVDNITELLTLKFIDPLNELIFDEVEIDFAHAAKQFSDYPNLVDEYNNEDRLVYGPKDGFVYCYFYNDDITNIITVDSPTTIIDSMVDFDDVVFSGFDDVEFEAEFTP